MVAIDLPVSAIGSGVRVMASGVGDSAGPVSIDVAVTGASVRPPSPTHLAITPEGGDGRLRWARRSRSGWRWIDGADAPLGEEREAYQLAITPPGGTLRTLTANSPELLLSGVVAGTQVALRQLGNGGESRAVTITID